MTDSSEFSTIAEILTLETLTEGRFRSPRNEGNHNGRIYGGQLLGQSVAAALRTVAPDRLPTMLQLVFLAGARPERPIDYEVTKRQDGKRFSSRHVLASQGETGIVDAQVTCSANVEGVRHQAPVGAPIVPPAEGRPYDGFGEAMIRRLSATGVHRMAANPEIECRFIAPDRDLFPSAPGTSLRFWIRIGRALPADPHLHAAAFAYLSDWWLNYISIAPHIDTAPAGGLYVASLNHTIWFHAPCRADDWLLVVSESPWANAARGLSYGRVYRTDGVMVASLAQEALLVAAT